MPKRSSWGVCLVVSCFQELCAYSARGSSCAQLVCRPVVYARRYCSTQAFILSVCPSVLGWNAMERFCWMPRLLHSAVENRDANLGSLSEMILLGAPNHGTRCFRYSSATPGPSIILLHGMNFAALVHPWFTMVRMESNLLDFGRSMMRSIDTYWKGPCSTGVLNGWSGARSLLTFVLVSWHVGHPLTYLSTNCLSRGPLYCCFTRFHVLAMLGCPAVGVS
jgi:hypothetical protein